MTKQNDKDISNVFVLGVVLFIISFLFLLTLIIIEEHNGTINSTDCRSACVDAKDACQASLCLEECVPHSKPLALAEQRERSLMVCHG